MRTGCKPRCCRPDDRFDLIGADRPVQASRALNLLDAVVLDIDIFCYCRQDYAVFRNDIDGICVRRRPIPRLSSGAAPCAAVRRAIKQPSWQSRARSSAAERRPVARPTWTPPEAKVVKRFTQKRHGDRCRRPSGQHTQLRIEHEHAARRRRRVRRTVKA